MSVPALNQIKLNKEDNYLVAKIKIRKSWYHSNGFKRLPLIEVNLSSSLNIKKKRQMQILVRREY